MGEEVLSENRGRAEFGDIFIFGLFFFLKRLNFLFVQIFGVVKFFIVQKSLIDLCNMNLTLKPMSKRAGGADNVTSLLCDGGGEYILLS